MSSSPLDPRTAWQRYCGFLDLSPQAFSNVQLSLLREQFELIEDSPSGRRFLPLGAPATADSFRATAPLTTYEDYDGLINPEGRRPKHGDGSMWAYTLYGAGREKWIPFTARAFDLFLDNVMATLILSSAERPGDVRIRPGDRVLYNVPPRPFLAGFAASGLVDRFGIVGLPAPDEAEPMEFKTRVRAGLDAALRDRVDIIISLTSVLMKVGEKFESDLSASSNGEQKASARTARPNHRALGRMARAKVKSVIGRRDVRPHDLWRPKAVVGWGLDTRFFRDRVADYWGRPPFEMYASTEGGVMGVQARPGGGMVLNPHSVFYEFIPESELELARRDPEHAPATVLLDEVSPGSTYELVITNFHGMPLLRYRTGHLLRFTKDQAASSHEFEFVGRSDERIDIAGFTRIDESTVWAAMNTAGIQARDWTLRREGAGGELALHMYAECACACNPESIAVRLHDSLRKLDPLYRDLDMMLGIKPLKITRLPAGAFDRYYDVKRREGRALALCRPPRMNAGDEVISTLLAAGAAAVEAAA